LETTLERFAALRGLGLALLGPEDRRRVYEAPRLLVVVDRHGDVYISGLLDADITEVMVTPSEARVRLPPPGRKWAGHRSRVI
jgi:hypothetical protein